MIKNTNDGELKQSKTMDEIDDFDVDYDLGSNPQ
jgi:hypothetical protein